jgi:hypothetical protein
MYQLKIKFFEIMPIPFDKEEGNRRQQLQRVYNEIIHGNLAEFRQEQAYRKCEKECFLSKKLMPLAVHFVRFIYISSGNMNF